MADLMKNFHPGKSRKMAIIKQMDGRSLTGYLIPQELSCAESIDLLTPQGEHLLIELGAIQKVYFVGNFTEPVDPVRNTFLSRPKLPGLWVRMTFRDGETQEGILTNDLLDMLDNGLQVVPPDFSGNCHRIFVPRSALAGLIVLGVVGATRPRRLAATTIARDPSAIQQTLFDKPEH